MGRLTIRSSVRGWLAALALVSGILLFIATPATAAEPVGQLSWSAPFNVDPPPTQGYVGESTSAVSCPSESLCVAVDVQGNVVTSTEPANTGGAWTITHVDSHEHRRILGMHHPATRARRPESQPRRSRLPVDVAVRRLGRPRIRICTSTDPADGARAWSSFQSDQRQDPARCRAQPFRCVWRTAEGAVFNSVDPTGGAAAWHSARVDVGRCPPQARVPGSVRRSDRAVSCPTASFCAAGDGDGNVLTTTEPTNGAHGRVTYVDSENSWGPRSWRRAPDRNRREWSCPDSSHCVATDESGAALISGGPDRAKRPHGRSATSRSSRGATRRPLLSVRRQMCPGL